MRFINIKLKFTLSFLIFETIIEHKKYIATKIGPIELQRKALFENAFGILNMHFFVQFRDFSHMNAMFRFHIRFFALMFYFTNFPLVVKLSSYESDFLRKYATNYCQQISVISIKQQ